MGGAYAGIGSRRTPASILDLIEDVANNLAQKGWVLRSGAADGADTAFEVGAKQWGDIELYLPWQSFNQFRRYKGKVIPPAKSRLAYPTHAALELAAKYHPAWNQLSRGPRALHARNCHQILGPELNDPVRFVLCWTPDGCIDNPTKETGGTGQAIRLANAHNIPVFNLERPDHQLRICRMLDNI